MYAIINLDDENKGMLTVSMRTEIITNQVKQNFDGDSVYMDESSVVGKNCKYSTYHKFLLSQLVFIR